MSEETRTKQTNLLQHPIILKRKKKCTWIELHLQVEKKKRGLERNWVAKRKGNYNGKSSRRSRNWVFFFSTSLQQLKKKEFSFFLKVKSLIHPESFPSLKREHKLNTDLKVSQLILFQVLTFLLFYPSSSSLVSSCVGVFTHSLPIKCLLTGVLGCSPVMTHKMCVEDSSVTVLQHSWRNGWQIKRMNDTAHLRLL